jgi:hypothetical protein
MRQLLICRGNGHEEPSPVSYVPVLWRFPNKSESETAYWTDVLGLDSIVLGTSVNVTGESRFLPLPHQRRSLLPLHEVTKNQLIERLAANCFFTSCLNCHLESSTLPHQRRSVLSLREESRDQHIEPLASTVPSLPD